MIPRSIATIAPVDNPEVLELPTAVAVGVEGDVLVKDIWLVTDVLWIEADVVFLETMEAIFDDAVPDDIFEVDVTEDRWVVAGVTAAAFVVVALGTSVAGMSRFSKIPIVACSPGGCGNGGV
jgi:hypothetical protein